MHRAKTIIAKLAIIAVLSLGLSGLTATPAAAYGNTAQYQIEFSFNCNTTSDPCFAQFGYGGLWGWIALNQDGTADVEITVCGHDRAGHGGAFHESSDGTWSSAGGFLLVTTQNFGTLGFPATAGHYFFDVNMNLLSHPTPAAAEEITVVLIPNR